MRRQDNPILLWLIAVTAFRVRAALKADDEFEHAFWHGQRYILLRYQLVCRWLDAEDEWVEPLSDEFAFEFYEWKAWRQARMAEAGVL